MWKKYFFDLQCRNNETDALKIKLQNFPDKFYKYRCLNDFTFESLINSEVFLANSNMLNDPYECYYSMNLNEVARDQLSKQLKSLPFPKQFVDEILSAEKPYHKFVESCQSLGINSFKDADLTMQEKLSQHKEIIERQKTEIRISCFTTRKDSILMWSHYAEQHKGICIEYDFRANRDLEERIQPVQYLDLQFDMTNYIYPDFAPASALLGIYISSLTKAQDWQYEDEWRLITNMGSEKHDVPAPTAIYLGTRFNQNCQQHIDKLRSIARELNIPLIQMKMHSSLYSIVTD